MPKVEEPSYRTAHESGHLICPETGVDLSEWEAASIRAHAENLYPDYAKENFSEEAATRKAILLKMAKDKEK